MSVLYLREFIIIIGTSIMLCDNSINRELTKLLPNQEQVSRIIIIFLPRMMVRWLKSLPANSWEDSFTSRLLTLSRAKAVLVNFHWLAQHLHGTSYSHFHVYVLDGLAVYITVFWTGGERLTPPCSLFFFAFLLCSCIIHEC